MVDSHERWNAHTGRRRQKGVRRPMATTNSEDNESFGAPNPLAGFHEASVDESVDKYYETLSSQRRRELLYVLRSVDAEKVNLSELASIVAAWEQDIDDPSAVMYDGRKSIQTTISQHHVPKLADAGLIDYDEETRELALAVKPASLRLSDVPSGAPAADGDRAADVVGSGAATGGGGTPDNKHPPDGSRTAADGIDVSYRVTAMIATVFAAVGVVVGVRATDVWPLLIASSAAAGALLVVAYGDWRSAA